VWYITYHFNEALIMENFATIIPILSWFKTQSWESCVSKQSSAKRSSSSCPYCDNTVFLQWM